MSFHDVDRYRGSCLIVSKPRGRFSSQSMGGRSRPSQEGHSKREAASHFGGSSGRGAPHHHGAMEGPPFRPGYLMEGGSALAGMPLFSLMPHRRGGKHPPRPHQHQVAQYRSGGGGGRTSTGRSSHGAAGTGGNGSAHDHRELQQSPRERHDSGDSQGGPLVDPNELDEVERIPLARLALHTQGAPLILPNRGKKGPGAPKNGTVHDGGGGERGLRAESKGPRDDTSPLTSSDAVSVTSDEGSTGHSENSLPRIIKPRKRRKKDRKPGGGGGGSGGAGGGGGGGGNASGGGGAGGTGPNSCSTGGQDPEGEDTSGTIVTLKPYMPMCYNYDEDSNSSCSSSSSSRSSSCNTSTSPSCSSTNSSIHTSLPSATSTAGGTTSVSATTVTAAFCSRGDGATAPTTKCGSSPEERTCRLLSSGSSYPYAPHRQCGCLHCIGGVFPTPPPSPAASSTSSTSCSLSSAASLSSGSDDEPHPPLLRSLSEPHQAGMGAFSRSLSEPQAVSNTTRIQISSTVSHSFSGHRDIDIKFIKSDGLEGDSGHTPQGRARHYSVPLPYRERRYSEESSASTASTSSTSREQEFAIYHKYAVSAAPPPQRPWLTVAQPDRNNPCSIYTVMCYNVLCDKYATRQMYGYCPSWALDWEYRKKGIFEEIRQYMADIITLQEIETDQFYNFFLPQLKSEGYNGIFSPKSRAKTMAASERKYVDGCAIFWRTNKFALLKEHLIEFNQLAMANHEGSEEMLNRVMTKDNIGLAALLETKEAAWEGSEVQPDPSQVNQAILVCTAHIHWDPEYCDVKLIQTMMLMSEVRQIIEASQQAFRPGHKMDVNNIHLLLCGDLNSLPDSGVVEFLTKGSIPMDHPDFKELGYKSCLQKLSTVNKPNSNMYTHNFKIADSYNTAVMPYTNYTYDFKGVIDYIFHNHTTMKVLALLGAIDPDWFRDNKVAGCPHPHIPSDHFPLLVQLEMRPLPPANSPANGLLRR